MKSMIWSRDPGFFPQCRTVMQHWAKTVSLQVEIRQLERLEEPAEEQQDLLLLDVDGMLPEELERLETLRDRWEVLIVCSQEPKAAIPCYRLRPTAFLRKPFSAAALDTAMGRCVSIWQKSCQSLELTDNRKRLKVHLCDIYYVGAMGRSSVLHCLRRDVKVGKSISELLEDLPKENFIRCQKSFLVNLYHVRSTDGKFLYMTDGTSVPVGRGLQIDVGKVLQESQQQWNAEPEKGTMVEIS